MKKLVAWTEEPVLVASVANGEMSGGVEMEHEMLHAEEVEKDEPDSVQDAGEMNASQAIG